MNNTHCKASGCRAKIGSTFLMCAKHWNMVPADIQDKVWKTAEPYRKVNPREVSDEIFYKLRNDYYSAVKLALVSVLEQEKKNDLPA